MYVLHIDLNAINIWLGFSSDDESEDATEWVWFYPWLDAVEYFIRDEKTPSPIPKPGKLVKRCIIISSIWHALTYYLFNSAIASTNSTPRSAKKARVASSPEVEEEEAELYVAVHLLIERSMFHVVMISQQYI